MCFSVAPPRYAIVRCPPPLPRLERCLWVEMIAGGGGGGAVRRFLVVAYVWAPLGLGSTARESDFDGAYIRPFRRPMAF